MRYLPALDGLRAVAVGAVLVFHANSPLAPGGFLGVSLFFTLSGFLITSLLLAEQASTGSIGLGRFYARRARRLLPAACACLGLVVLLGGAWTVEARRELPGDVLAALANVANWRFAFSPESYSDLFAGEASPVAHFWSLSIEEQLYLALPMVIVVALRWGRSALLGVISLLLAASVTATLVTSDHDLIYNGTHTRAAELLVGALLAVFLARRRTTPRASAAASVVGVGSLALFGVLVARVGLADDWLYRGGFVAVAFVSGALIVAVARGAWPAPVLAARPLVAVGKVSYGIYLFHWPVFLLVTSARTGLQGVWLFTAQCAVTAGLTVVSYHGLESPIRAGRRLVSERGAALTGGAAVASIAAGAILVTPLPPLTETESLLALGAEPGRSGVVVFGGGHDDEASGVGATAPVVVADRSRAGESATAVPVGADVTAGWSTQTAFDPVDEPLLLVVGSDPGPVPSLRAAGYRVADATVADCPLNVAPGDERCDGEPARWSQLARWLSADGVIVSAGREENGLWLDRLASADGAEELLELAAVRAEMFARLRGGVDSLLADGVPVGVFYPHPVGSMYDVVLGELAAIQPRMAGIARDDAALTSMVGRHGFLPPTGTEAALAVEDPPTADDPAVRVLVLGDSTSLGVARALGDAGDGQVVVAWGGASGCPIARVASMRSSSSSEWRTPDCAPFDVAVPPLLQQFQPDVAVLVVGPTELTEQQYPGREGSFLPGDPEYTDFHLSEIDALRRILAEQGVGLLVADVPDIDAGSFATPEMAQPWRVDALNAVLADAAARWPDVGLIAYRDAVLAMEAVHGSIRSDGAHVDVGPLAVLARDSLLDQVLAGRRRPESG